MAGRQSRIDRQSPAKRGYEAAVCLALVLMVLAVYLQTTSHEFVSFDDGDYIAENPFLKEGLTWNAVVWAFTTGYVGAWHPVTWLSLIIDYQIFGPDPAGHHWMNFQIHLFNSILLFLVLRWRTGSFWRSAVVAALFAVHPINVESVAWASERKNVLSTFFWLITMAAYARYSDRPTTGRYALLLLLFAFGLMAKPMVVTLPFVFLLLDYWPLGRLPDPGEADFRAAFRRFGQLVAEKIPLFALSAAASIITFLVERSIGTVISLETLPLRMRLANAVTSYGAYLANLVWPADLAYLYPYTKPQWTEVAAAGLLIALITACALFYCRRHPYLLVGWLWFLGTLVPVIGLVQVSIQRFADRYAYIPSIGIFLAAAWLLPALARRVPRRSVVLTAAAIAAIAALMATAHRQAGYWRDDIRLFSRAARVTQNNHSAIVSLGMALARAGRSDAAIAQLKRAIRMKPASPDAYSGLGVVLFEKSDRKSAMSWYRKALEMDPNHAPTHNNLGLWYESTDPEKAVFHYFRALAVNPRMVKAYRNLGILYMKMGRYKEATGHFFEAMKIDPHHPLPYVNLGFIMVATGNLKEARALWRRAHQLDPQDPLVNQNLATLEKTLSEK